MSWRQPLSLQARQVLVASLGLVAFLALAGYALDRAFLETAKGNLRERMRSYALAFADSDFARDGTFIPPYDLPDPRFERPGSGLDRCGALLDLDQREVGRMVGEPAADRFKPQLSLARQVQQPGVVARVEVGVALQGPSDGPRQLAVDPLAGARKHSSASPATSTRTRSRPSPAWSTLTTRAPGSRRP